MDLYFYIVPDIENPFFAAFGALMQRRLSRHGANLCVLNSDNSVSDELRHIQACMESIKTGECAGIIFISSGDNLESYRTLRQIIESENDHGWVPIVVVDREIKDSDFFSSNILCDNDYGIKIGLQHLREYGHIKIGFLEGALNTDPGKIRKDAFVRYCRVLGIENRPEWTFEGNFTFRSGRDAAVSLLRLNTSEWPTAIFCSNDLCAAGLIQQLHLSGKRVPDDMSVLGFDGSPLSGWMTPSLSTIAQPIEEMASVAEFALLSARSSKEESLLSNSNGVARSKKVVWKNPTLSIRQSVRHL